jgi:hypothetical protein
MGYLELSEYDRERYNVPERIDFVPHQFGMRAIKALRKHTGYTYEILAELLAGIPRLDPETKEPVFERDDAGEVVYEDGEPKIVRDMDEDAVAAYVWLVLWNAGHHLDWETFDIIPADLTIKLLSDEEPEPGKAEESLTTTSPG